MNWTAQNVVYGRDFVKTLIAALKVAPDDPLINTAKVRLSQDPTFNPSPDSTVAGLDANEATFSGYSAGGLALTVGVPVNLTTLIIGATTPTLFVVATATPVVGNDIYGWWIDDGTNVIAGEKFPAGGAASMNLVGDFIQLDVSVGVSLYQAVR